MRPRELIRIVAAIAAAASAAACAHSPATVPLSAEEITARTQEVGRVLDEWHAAAARADEAAYFGAFAAHGVFLGTDATERWDVPAFRAYAHPHFAKGKAWAFTSTRRTVHFEANGAVAWFDEDLKTEKLGPARGSGVLVREGNAYKIAQYNLSIPIADVQVARRHSLPTSRSPNERFASVKKVIAGEAP